jgi:hypothetical protein
MKTAIRVIEGNLDKIQEKIDFMQLKAKVRTIKGIDVINTITEIENRLYSILHKKDWDGLSFTIDENAQSFPAAYKYMPESTIYRLERRKSGWFLVWVMRSHSRPKKFVVCGMETKAEHLAAFIALRF